MEKIWAFIKKNKILVGVLLGIILIGSVVLILISTSKSDKHNYKKVMDGSTFRMVCDCGEISDGYRIQFVYAEDGAQADADIEVSWINKKGRKFTEKTDELGYVENLRLKDDSYQLSVNKNTLPSINGVKYSYNASAFKTQTNGIGLIIPLFAVAEPTETNSISVQDTTYMCSSIELNKTYFATINNATQSVWFNLQNNGCGKYTIDATLAGKTNVEIDRYFGSLYYVNPEPDSKTDKSVQNKLTYTVINTDSTQNSLFCIKCPNASSYPITIPFSVSITYTPTDVSVSDETLVIPTHFETEEDTYSYYTTERGSNKPLEQTTKSLKPIASVEKWKDVEGSVVHNLTEEQYASMQLRDDGYYYVSNNQMVFVKLSTTSIFEELTLASYLIDSNPPSFAIYRFSEQNEYGFYTRRDNYFGFVQAYAALANSDGLYPLTEEMLDYLQIVAKKEHHTVNELLCTYPEQASEFTQGNGTQNNPYALALNEQTLGYYKLTIPAGGKVYVELSGTMDVALTFNSNVKATVGTSPYDEYFSLNGTKVITFETKNGNEQSFVLKIAKYDDPYYLELGSNENTIAPNTKADYAFVAPKAGTYDISISTSNVIATATYNEEKYEINGNTVTITVNAGDSIFFEAKTSLTIETSFSFIIQENTLE